MATQITLPRLSPGMNEAAVSRWLKRNGETVKQGEPLFEVETEKVATEVPAPADGVLSIVVPEGRTVTIGTLLATINGSTAEAPTAEPRTAEAPKVGEPKPVAVEEREPAAVEAPTSVAAEQPRREDAPATPAAPPVPEAEEEQRVVASPLARRMAREMGISLEGLKGSGPGGRIIEKDILAVAPAKEPETPRPIEAPPPAPVPVAAAAPAAAAAGARPLSGMRKVIAERMLLSQNTNATVTLTLEVDMQEATSLRQQLVGEWEQREGVRVTFTDLIVKAVATALTEHRRLNASLQGDQIVEHGEVHVGVAVALDDGLIVPVVRDADRKSILEIGRDTKQLGERARANRLGIDEVTGGTFSVTNLGQAGIDAFTPIINPPQCAILGVGKIAPKPVAREGQVVVRPQMWLSLTFDHRIVDGHPAALFLARVKEILEKPYLLFV
jgi:pyruvate dehydrogenase E2 component (dihydrolipoamide acetyltransferase)